MADQRSIRCKLQKGSRRGLFTILIRVSPNISWGNFRRKVYGFIFIEATNTVGKNILHTCQESSRVLWCKSFLFYFAIGIYISGKSTDDELHFEGDFWAIALGVIWIIPPNVLFFLAESGNILEGDSDGEVGRIAEDHFHLVFPESVEHEVIFSN